MVNVLCDIQEFFTRSKMRHKFLERDALMAIGTALLALLQNIQYRLQNNPEFTAVGLWLMTGVYTSLV